MDVAVVIELSVGSPYADTMVAACSNAVATGGCVLGERMAPGARPRAVAIVFSEGPDDLHVQIEVGLRNGTRAERLTRNLSFSEHDPPVERWRSVGLVIAALAGEVSEPPADTVIKKPDAGTRPPARAPDAPRPGKTIPAADRPRSWRFDAAPLAGLDPAEGTWSAGGLLRGTWAFPRTPVFALGSLRFAAEIPVGELVELTWASASLGVGVRSPATRVGFGAEARVEIVAGLLAATGIDPTTGEQDRGYRWLGGVRLGADGVWMLTPAAGVIVGLDATASSGSTDVRMAPHIIARAGFLRVETALGVRIALP